MISTTRKFSSHARRALFNVPGSDSRKLAKIPSIKADSVVLDLEDGVPLARKGEARGMVTDSLNSANFAIGSERAVRINSVGSGLEDEDLRSILQSPKLEAIVIPKVDSRDHLGYVSAMIEKYCKDRRQRECMRLIPCIESAAAILELKEISRSDKRIDALVFASEDFCADTGISRTSDLSTLAFARSSVVTAARALKIQAIDIVCMDFKDARLLEFECTNGRQMGFTGKQAIHPGQIEAIQRLFSYSDAEIDRARRLLEAWRLVEQQGLGAFEFEGKMIDEPVLKACRSIINASKQQSM